MEKEIADSSLFPQETGLSCSLNLCQIVSRSRASFWKIRRILRLDSTHLFGAFNEWHFRESEAIEYDNSFRGPRDRDLIGQRQVEICFHQGIYKGEGIKNFFSEIVDLEFYCHFGELFNKIYRRKLEFTKQ